MNVLLTRHRLYRRQASSPFSRIADHAASRACAQSQLPRLHRGWRSSAATPYNRKQSKARSMVSIPRITSFTQWAPGKISSPWTGRAPPLSATPVFPAECDASFISAGSEPLQAHRSTFAAGSKQGRSSRHFPTAYRRFTSGRASSSARAARAGR